ncbi:hypothetical protein DSO57_1012760 [Entomophthora muscae]|uniref:Uncharacterized protein n=1 Tax=Entomophthora muscae TaxID=34485 RepID=A0ACC2TH90_9FUNG|nr:hypothetical protein DSO57_1012760 [Entomophthora muscae]
MSMAGRSRKVKASPSENSSDPVENKQFDDVSKNPNHYFSSSLFFKMTAFITLFLSVSYLVLKFGLVSSHSDESDGSENDLQKKVVTFNSLVKLGHVESNFRLHSQEAKYGTGSGQQVVSSYPSGSDTDSFWVVSDSHGANLSPHGTPVACNSVISLQHLSTKHHLHSHLHESPLSDQQEVSGFGGHDSGDNWKVICLDSKGKEAKTDFWYRNEKIMLQHIDTSKYLASSKKYKYPEPIAGQLEVFATNKKSPEAQWYTKEGMFFPYLPDEL